jgi:hypothetical protein
VPLVQLFVTVCVFGVCTLGRLSTTTRNVETGRLDGSCLGRCLEAGAAGAALARSSASARRRRSVAPPVTPSFCFSLASSSSGTDANSIPPRRPHVSGMGWAKAPATRAVPRSSAAWSRGRRTVSVSPTMARACACGWAYKAGIAVVLVVLILFFLVDVRARPGRLLLHRAVTVAVIVVLRHGGAPYRRHLQQKRLVERMRPRGNNVSLECGL